MKYRLALLVPALAAMVAGVLVATPAEAASHDAYLKSKAIAISAAGNGKVAVQCRARSTCRGTVAFVDGGTSKTRSFAVPAGSTRYVAVAMNSGATPNPNNGGTSVNGEYLRKSAVLRLRETSPRKRLTSYNVTTESVKKRQQITGDAIGPAGTAGDVDNLRVELIKVERGGNTRVMAFDEDLSDGYTFGVNLGANNSPSSYYRLRISGRDQDGIARSWFWRGTDGTQVGGGRYLRDASPIRATKSSDFDADFRFTSIKGSAPAGTSVTVAGIPKSYSGSTARRELDLVGCANVFGQTRASGGTYRVNFLPYSSGSPDRRYMVGAKDSANEVWNNQFGSCFDVLDYSYSKRQNLLALTASELTYNLTIGDSNNDLTVDASYPGFNETAQGDRWIRLREKVPSVPILDAPVVAEGMASSAGVRVFRDVPPGRYWVEVGRRTGCSDWAPSLFPNNRAYFKGVDRGHERWKAFTTLSSLPGSSSNGLERIARTTQPNPATSAEQGKRPKGRAGWMYRAHCKALGAGTYRTKSISGFGNTSAINLTNKKGAVVSGRVTRTGGRTNKEIMVRLTSAAGTRVVRTDITDGSGRFYVAGLASGTWRIEVNSDSWRGIKRGFSGKHSVKVTAGRSYGVGTLRFQG